MRHQHDETSRTSPIKAAKESLRKSLTEGLASVVEVPDINSLHMDDKVILFRYKLLKVLVYDEQPEDLKLLGRLLGHGAIEIFQLHNGDVTYLAVGPSIIYPLLPKLKVLRIAFNQFIIPLVYPERYWKVFVNSEEPHVLQVLQNTFDRVVKYRDLYQRQEFDIDKQPVELKLVNGDLPFEVPPSPPLEPISPRLEANWQIHRQVSDQSISTAMACLDMLKPKKVIHEPLDEEESSMDSLLDEYEASICYLRLIALRQPLRQPLRRNLISLKRGLVYRLREDFPSTLLLEYHRTHNAGPLVRLRRSLRSEFHVPHYEWADTPQRLPKTRSTYSMNSTNSDLNLTYRYIYKSIAQRNMRPADDDRRTIPPTPPIPKKYLDAHKKVTDVPQTQSHNLDLTEIYNLLGTSGKRKPSEPVNKSLALRLFGW